MMRRLARPVPPNPQIKTIYPTGTHRLPATCPPGMARLAGYGSCRTWEAETAEDVAWRHESVDTLIDLILEHEREN